MKVLINGIVYVPETQKDKKHKGYRDFLLRVLRTVPLDENGGDQFDTVQYALDVLGYNTDEVEELRDFCDFIDEILGDEEGLYKYKKGDLSADLKFLKKG